jgi:uncharacterized protein with NRDE domain
LGLSPHLAGGRDRTAGGTWLAIRERRALVALLNRRDTGDRGGLPRPDRRSRGWLTLDVAGTLEDEPIAAIDADLAPAGAASGSSALARAAALRALDAHRTHYYAPYSLVFASPDACWWFTHDGTGDPRLAEIGPGWHVLTHMELDDPGEPRTTRLLRALSTQPPATLAAAEERLEELLRANDPPAVCLHEGPIETVSSAMVYLSHDEARYRHVEGRPCERPWTDVTSLLSATAFAKESP